MALLQQWLLGATGAGAWTREEAKSMTGRIGDAHDDVIEHLGFLVEASKKGHPVRTANAVPSEVGLIESIPRWGWGV